MKIRFKKLEATTAFIKLFGVNRHTSDAEPAETRETDDAFEYYYKRGNTYYFRNNAGEKFSIEYKEPQKEFVKGNRYKMDAINTPDR